MVSVSPIEVFLGLTEVITGAFFFFLAACASGATAPASAEATMAPRAAIVAARRGIGRVRARSSIALDIGRDPSRLERARADQATTLGRLRRRGEDLAALLGDHDEVLDPRSAAARDVDPGLHGHDLAGLEARLDALREAGVLVDLQADAVAEAVAEVLAVSGGLDEVARGRVDLLPARPARTAATPACCAASTVAWISASSSGSSPVAHVRVQSAQ